MLISFRRLAAATLLAAVSPAGFSQAVPTTTSAPADEDRVLQLSAFQVSTASDRGYRAGNSISATRINTPIKDLPFSISAFTQQFMTDIAARDLWDVVQYAPGVTSSGREFNAGNAVYSIRGFDQAPQHNGFVGEAYVDTATIERVEVVKGPASVLYGQVAPGGTVNYITKRAQARPFTLLSANYGSYDAWRGSLDLNQPLVGKTLLLRLNAAWENMEQYVKPFKGRTHVLAPNLVWAPNERVTFSVDYQWFNRRESAPAQFKPNIDIVALPPASGILGTSGVLVKPDNSDFGFNSYYPLPRTFNYSSSNDWRHADFESINSELTMKLTEHWTARANFNWNKRSDAQKLTGLGQVSVTVPGNYYPAGATIPPSAADYLAAASAYAAVLVNDPNQALNAPIAQLARRKRLQEDFGYGRAWQTEVTGDYAFTWGKLKPLIGAFYNDSIAYSRVRQSGGAGFAIFTPWDMKNPATWDLTTDFDPTSLPITTNTRTIVRNSAGYAVLNSSLLDDRLSVVAGVRYTKATGSTDNFLTPASSIAKLAANKTVPQLGVGYKVVKDVLVYGSYSQSFVLNAANLQFQNVPIGPAKPTTSEGYELGVKTDLFAGRVSSTIAVYQIDQKDRVLRFNSFNSAGVTVTNSLQGTLDRSEGIEAEVTWSPLDNWQVYVSGAIDNVTVKQVPLGEEFLLGSHPEATVRDLANLWTRYSFKTGSTKGLWVGAGFNYTGQKAQRVNNPRLFMPAYTLWNAALGYDWKWNAHNLSAALNWQNISNEEYFPANQQRGLPERVTFSISARF